MTIRPEDYGGTTDPLAPLANLSTRAGHGAGKAIDPTRPSAADLAPNPTADRIAELKGTIADLEAADAPAHTADAARAELSRLRNPELNSRGEPMDAATIARGRKPTNEENAPLRNEQPKGGERAAPYIDGYLTRRYEAGPHD